MLGDESWKDENAEFRVCGLGFRVLGCGRFHWRMKMGTGAPSRFSPEPDITEKSVFHAF